MAMKKISLLGLLMLCSCLAVTAQSEFNGTWKANLNNFQPPTKPDEYILKEGMYNCKTCVPPYDIKADGTDQAVSGHPYMDTIAIKVVDDRTIEETDKKNGKVVSTSKVVVSTDGKTSQFEFSDSSASSGDPITGKGESMRVGTQPAGSHAVSGSWRTTKIESLSDNGLTTTYKVEGDNLTMSSPTGQGYTAKLDGTDAPYKGDPGTTSVSVKSVGKNTIEETDKRDGKVIGVSKMTVSADGKTMNIEYTDKLHGTSSKITATKQ
jgi:hypothetical protein